MDVRKVIQKQLDKIDLKEELTQALHFHHKYETPEWIFQSAESSKGYLEWMNQSE